MAVSACNQAPREFQATCSPKCAMNLITVEPAGGTVQKMEDLLDMKTCTTRTFTCRGGDGTINLWGENNAALESVKDPGTGITTVPVTCDEADSAWKYKAKIVKKVNCEAVAGTCRTCADTLIKVADNSEPMTPMKEFTDCAKIEYTCMGLGATLKSYKADGTIVDTITEIDNSRTASISAKCNEVGDGWVAKDEVIERVECKVCKKCDADSLKVIPDDEPYGKMMDDDMTTAECIRTLTCMGTSAAIRLFENNPRVPAGQITDADQGRVNAVVLTFTCSEAGEWLLADSPITGVACTAFPLPLG